MNLPGYPGGGCQIPVPFIGLAFFMRFEMTRRQELMTLIRLQCQAIILNPNKLDHYVNEIYQIIQELIELEHGKL